MLIFHTCKNNLSVVAVVEKPRYTLEYLYSGLKVAFNTVLQICLRQLNSTNPNDVQLYIFLRMLKKMKCIYSFHTCSDMC